MPYIDFQSGWGITSTAAIDKRLLLTKAQMVTASSDDPEFLLPDYYFCICTEDGCVYLYDVNNPQDATTGKYRKLEAEGKVKDVLVDDVSVVDSEGYAYIDFLDWSLRDETGHSVELSVDSEYKLSATLKDVSGVVLNTSVIDLPLEEMIINATYDSATKELVLTLKNGNVIRVPLGDIVSGLAKQADLDAEVLRAQEAEQDLQDAIDSECSRIEAIEDRLPAGTDELATKQYVDDTFITDVKVNDVSVVTDNVANIPKANGRSYGVVASNTNYGVGINANGQVYITGATDAQISGRSSATMPITASNYDKAVKAHLTDGVAAEYTAVEKEAARERLGIDLSGKQDKLTAGDYITIDDDNKISADVVEYTAGENIQISNTNVISATDTTYNAGNGIDITSNVISANVDGDSIIFNGSNQLKVNSKELVAGTGLKTHDGIVEVDTSVIPTNTELVNNYQGKLIAGSNITISGNTISANATAGLTYLIVDALPSTGVANTIYLLRASITPIVYDEYMWINESFAKIGSTTADLTNYFTKTETASLLANKQDNLVSSYNIKTINGNTVLGSGNIDISANYTAGNNIQINNNVISATDTTYTAGSGIQITGNVISATGGGTSGANWGSIGGTLSNQIDLSNALNAKQGKLTAGTNITIDANNVISATGGSGSATWGGIGGTLSNQTDLQNALNAKADATSIPTVNNGALTIARNGVSLGSFTANQALASTVNIKVPTFSYNSTTGVLSITDN